MPKNPDKFFWKGKRVTEKVYKLRLKQQEIGKNARNLYGTKNNTHNLQISSPYKLDGRRIIHLETLGKQLICKKCNNLLSLLDVLQEKHCGLASKMYISCRSCHNVNIVFTDKQHVVAENSQQQKHFDCNTKAAIGVASAGMGCTHLNRVLTELNIPSLNWNTFKEHTKEIAPVIENMVTASCMRATNEERQMTLDNLEDMKKLL